MMNTIREKHRLLRYLVVPLALPLLAVAMSAAPVRAPKITQFYVTAETSTSASVIWNTSTASDSLLQYSTSHPVPANAMQVYVATQVTLHDIPLAGLTPGTLYFYKVRSCTKRGCTSATGSSATVNNHIKHILTKLDVHTRLEAIRHAENAGVI